MASVSMCLISVLDPKPSRPCTRVKGVHGRETGVASPKPQLAAGLTATDVYRDHAVLSPRDNHVHRFS